MIILLPIRIKPTGGTSTFAKKFQSGMQARGHDVIFKWTPNYDALLCSPRAPFWVLIDAKLRGKKIIHRLDGVFYPGTSAGKWWRLHNIPLWIIRNLFADKIIYQGRFSKFLAKQYLPKQNNPKPETIIYNGVDTSLFTPKGETKNLRDNPDQKIFITWSRFRREDQIKPLLKAFNYYQQHINHNSKLIVIGNLSDRLVKQIDHVFRGHAQAERARSASATSGSEAEVKARSHAGRATPGRERHGSICFTNPLPNDKIPAYARAADVFVMTHANPPCPNNVIEALACGLPVCGIRNGAMPELVEEGIQGYLSQPDNAEHFARNMLQCLHLNTVSTNLSLSTMTKTYAKYIFAS